MSTEGNENQGSEETANEAQKVNEEGAQTEEPTQAPAQPAVDTTGIDARFKAIEEQLSNLTEAFTTMSVVNEDDNSGSDDSGSGIDDEYGEALELDDVERMLGL